MDAPKIFHDDEDGLQHELIDASQANRIVNTLKSLKDQINQSQVNKSNTLKSDQSMKEAVNFIEGGKMSVNLTQYEKTIDTRGGVGQSFDLGEMSHSKPAKMTPKMSYQKEVSLKKKEWRQFLRFMKKNPEALIGIADQTSAGGMQQHNHSVV